MTGSRVNTARPGYASFPCHLYSSGIYSGYWFWVWGAHLEFPEWSCIKRIIFAKTLTLPFLSQGLLYPRLASNSPGWSKMTLNLWSSCLCLLSADLHIWNALFGEGRILPQLHPSPSKALQGVPVQVFLAAPSLLLQLVICSLCLLPDVSLAAASSRSA